VQVENNVVFRVSDSAVAMTSGPAKGYAGNTFRNNIFADARRSMFKFSAPWAPEGCGEKPPLVNFIGNLFRFDPDVASGFQVMQGCSYSCGLDYDKFENFQGNLYWRVGDSRLFEVEPKGCGAPGDRLSFAQWQALKEDVAGTSSTDPGFGNKTHQPKDYLLTKNPVAGFDFQKTNDTIKNAGRSHPVIMPPDVPATFPAYSYREY
jgi:hypothetical protein